MGIRIAAAQAPSVAGDIAANIETHLRFIAAVRAEGVQLLLFPELSLCGYELPLLRDCALSPGGARLAPAPGPGNYLVIEEENGGWQGRVSPLAVD